MHNLNTTIFYALNDAANVYQWLDYFFVVLTSYSITVVSAILLYYLFYIVPKRAEHAGSRFRAYVQGIEVIVNTLFVWAVVYSIKVLAAIARPFTVIPDVRLLVLNESTYSFPSMHAAIATALATTVYFYHPRLGKLLFIFAGLIACSRVYVGVHYPIDVLVGILIGFVVPLSIHRLFSTRKIEVVN